MRQKFLVSVNKDIAEEIITHNKLLEYLAKDEENKVVWKFNHIVSHVGPLKPGNVDYKGSPYNPVILGRLPQNLYNLLRLTTQ
jgi:hypothetical protein